MNIAIIGYGKMGKMIEKLAGDRDVSISSIIDPHEKTAKFKDITLEAVYEADVCIDFSHPDVIIDNIKKLTELNKNMVIGTTGWYDQLPLVKRLVEMSGVGFIYAGNFSLGMNLYYKIIDYSSKIFNKFSEYDVAGLEMHHNMKADSPSGSARVIADILINNITEKTIPVFGTAKEKIKPEELSFASIRCGSIPGTHKIFFDSFSDTIELTHSVRNREGFANGALKSAEWINGKKGFYTFNDYINEVVG